MSRLGAFVGAGVVALGLGLSQPASASNVTSYYLFDGDSQRAMVVQNGVVTNSFGIPLLGYPVAIRGTIWLGNRDDAGADEFTLGGVATGNTGTGGNNFSQLLDGTSNGADKNYGVECCGGPNSVTVANADWSNQQSIFTIQGEGSGIAYDTSSDHLFVSMFDGSVTEYSLSGSILGSFNTSSFLVGLAYEQVSDTLWGYDYGNEQLVQYSKLGVELFRSADLDSCASFGVCNPYGGEMSLTGGGGPVPEPASLALLGAGLAGLGFARRRLKAAA